MRLVLLISKRCESSVILEGSKTSFQSAVEKTVFESSVILEGSKTYRSFKLCTLWFESSVILEGSKTQ